MKQVFDLEERMANYSALVLSFCDSIQKTYAGSTIANQLTRSGISVALNYAEAQSAESRKDFVHKMKISLKLIQFKITNNCFFYFLQNL